MLDGKLLAARRRELGLSSYGLGTRIGLSSMTVRRMEEGESQDSLNIVIVQRLLNELGLRWGELMKDELPDSGDNARLAVAEEDGLDFDEGAGGSRAWASSPSGTDGGVAAAEVESIDVRARLSAALLSQRTTVAGSTLAALCSIDANRLRRELRGLDESLRTAGMYVHHDGKDGFLLRPLNALDEASANLVERAQLLRRGLTSKQARKMRECLSGPSGGAGIDGVQLLNLSNRGLVVLSGKTVTISEQARFSLLMDELD